MKRASERRRAIAAAFALCAIVGHASMASAQTAEEKDAARARFEEGKTRRDRGDNAGALESFKAADATMNVPTTKLAVARAYAALGKLTEAREAAASVSQLPVAAKEPQPFTDARASAAELVTELDAKIAAAAEPKPQPTVEPARPQETKSEAAPDKAPEKRAFSPVVWAGLGVAAVGLAVGTGAGIASMSNKSDADDVCRDSKCPPRGYDALDSANRWATISTVGFIGAGAGIALAAVGYFVLGKKPPPAQTGSALRVSPWISAGSAGATGTF